MGVAVLAFAVGVARKGESTLKGDMITVVVGVVAWALFAFWLHGALIGVRPFG